MQRAALNRATQGVTPSNDPAIFEGFMARSIPEDQIRPRENVFTFQAWKALGRFVRKGEHGVKVVTWIEAESKQAEVQEGEDQKRSAFRFPKTTTVFHISQTEAVEKSAEVAA